MITRDVVRCAWVAVVGLIALVVTGARAADPGAPLPGTAPLTLEGDIAQHLVQGVDRFLDAEGARVAAARGEHWKRDVSSRAAYEKSVAPQRARLAKIIGVVEERVPFQAPAVVTTSRYQGVVAYGSSYQVIAVRWPAFQGPASFVVEGEGLLLEPSEGEPIANIVAIPDADWTPEAFCGLVNGLPVESRLPVRLASMGCRVLVPTIIDRSDLHSVIKGGRATNQPHREFLYRAAFEMGRHVIGYEVQKVLAAVDWFARERGNDKQPKIGVCGYGEGGLLALYAGALDPRIDATMVSGYFAPRDKLWQEPIYRNVWSLSVDFGDAEIASLVAPRALLIETAPVPAVDGPPAPRDGRSGAAPGKLTTPDPQQVAREVERARALVNGLESFPIGVAHSRVAGEALPKFLAALAPEAQMPEAVRIAHKLGMKTQPAERLARQFEQLNEFNQVLMRESEFTREKFFSKADKSSVEAWTKSTAAYKETLYRDVIGRFDRERLPPAPRSRVVFDQPKYTGYEVVLDVFPEVIAYGILLVPKGIGEGERRPVVVCQHGLEGRPQDVADPKVDNKAYNQYACRLAERGYVTYAPQNLYIFKDQFRTLQRKGNPLGKSLFSTIIPQHQAATDWLASLPFVDPQRIAFYGLSYGGKTAVRVPPLVDRYCLSICSADFNEWILKNVSNRHRYSYLGTGEYEMPEFDLGNTFNYAELSSLMAPRPFMVERGHHDGVAPDEWVAYEFAKVKRLYTALKIPEKAQIEFFDGPHSINGKGTFEFLDRELKWTPK